MKDTEDVCTEKESIFADVESSVYAKELCIEKETIYADDESSVYFIFWRTNFQRNAAHIFTS